MIKLENRLITTPSGFGGAYIAESFNGYFLTIDDLTKLVLDFEADYNSKDIVNTKSYIEEWLKKHEQIVKK